MTGVIIGLFIVAFAAGCGLGLALNARREVRELWAAMAKVTERLEAIQQLTHELSRRTITVGDDHRSVVELIEHVTDAVTATAVRLREVENVVIAPRRTMPSTARTTLLAPVTDIFEQLGED